MSVILIKKKKSRFLTWTTHVLCKYILNIIHYFFIQFLFAILLNDLIRSNKYLKEILFGQVYFIVVYILVYLSVYLFIQNISIALIKNISF